MRVLDSINETHDPKLQSWVESANQPDCDFPIQNLPFGVFEAERGPGIAAGTALAGGPAAECRA